MNELLKNYTTLSNDPRVSKYNGEDLRLLEERLRENPDDDDAAAHVVDRQGKLMTAYRSVCPRFVYVRVCGYFRPSAFDSSKISKPT